MKNSLIKGLMVFLTMLGTTLAYSQDVSGTVSDASGPLPGASVLVKGTTKGAQTDAAGKFTIKDAGANAVLTISYIGLKTQEVNVAGRSAVRVTLQDGATQLTDVIVVGNYGSLKKQDATGAVDQLSSKKFDNVAATSPAEILRGKVAGVQVTQSSGEPGAAMSVRIRGNSSLRSGNNPLYVIDGVPMEGGDISAGGANAGLGTSQAKNPLNFINQNDIESISILKDAASTAIYGSRAANGVVVITTKKSKSKEAELNYSNSFQFGSLATKFDVMSASEYVAAGGTKEGDGNYSWKDAILRNSVSTSHNLSYSKSSDNSNTRVSIGATNNEGIVKNTGVDKYTLGLSNSNDFFGGALKIDTKVLYASLKDKSTLITTNAGYFGNLIGSALYWNPTRDVYKADGTYNVVSTSYFNPVQMLNNYNDNTLTNKLIASVNTTFKINTKLKYQMLFGVENSTSTRKSEVLPGIVLENNAQADDKNGVKKYGQADISNNNRFNKTIEHQLVYNNTFGDNLSLDALIGYSFYQYNADGNSAQAKGFSPDQTNLIDNINGGVVSQFRADSYRNRSELQSYFGNVNATIYKNFILKASIRRDGSTKFGVNNKYGNFPAVGLAYKVINEKQGLINSLKVRTNYGIVGNQEFPVNVAITKSRYGYDNTFGTVNYGNSDLKWETTSSFGVGVDFEVFKNKLTGSVDYFTRDTKDFIFPKKQDATQPGENFVIYENLKQGILGNKGFELSLNYKVIDTEDLSWNVSANAAFLKSELRDFNPNNQPFFGELNGAGLSNVYSQKLANGQPAFSYFMLDFKGYDSSGNSLYADASGNPVSAGSAVKQFVGKQALPKTTVGFNTSLTYKNFDVVASFYGAFGHYIYNNTANALFFKGSLIGAGKNITSAVANSEQGAGDSNAASTKFLEKGDFIRLGNLSLGYNIKGDILERFKIKNARVFVNGSNLFIITNYTGFDPEVDTNKPVEGIPSAGIDYLSYPKDRSFSLGINVTF